MRKQYVNSLISVFILTFGALFAFAANESPQTFTLDGQLYAADHTSPLLDATAKIKVQILDPSKTCILYEEEQPLNTVASAGHFTIQVGSIVGSTKRKAYDAGNTMQKVYQNSSAIPALGPSCSGTYSPVLGAIRYVRVIVTPTAGSANTLTPDMVLDAVPNAMVAQSVQGLERDNILQSNPSASLTQTKLEQFFLSLTSGAGSSVKFDGTNFVAYDPSNGNNLTPSSVADSAISSVGWAKITSVPTGLTQIASLACADGKILKVVSGAWACASESGVGSESDPTVSAFAKNAPGNGLIVNGSSQIVPDFGSTGGKVAQGNDPRFSDSRAPNGSASGDLSGTYPSPTVAKLQGRGVSVTAPADGQVLRYNNSTTHWEPFNFGIGDLKTNAGTPQFISASCTASETLIWSSVTNTFQCTTIAINASQITGNIAGNAANVTGTVAIANGGTGQTTANAALNALVPSQASSSGKFLTTDGTNTSWGTPTISELDPKVGANTTNYLSKWNGSALVASGIVESGSNVGVGTATPAYPLHVVGSGVNALAVATASGQGVYFAVSNPTLMFNNMWNGSSHVSTASGQYGFRLESLPSGGAAFYTSSNAPAAGAAYTYNQVMTMTSAGNVGIGSATPTTKLDVNGTINATAMTINGVPVSAGGGDNLGNHTATQNLNLGAFKLVGNGGSSGLVISSSGQVGVGVASPGEALQVNGAVKATGTSGTLMASSTVVDNIFGTTARLISVGPNASTAGGFEFNAASSDSSINTNPMVILPNGRVGIGTASPTTKLEVNGTINASAITVNGVPIVTSSGVTSLNGSSQASQSFATPGVTGIAPNWSTNAGTGVHTLNIPMASSASVTAGLISKTDYDNFNSKLGTGSSLSGDVTGTPASTVVDRIKGVAVSAAPTLAGQVLRYTGSQFTPAFVSMADLRSQTTGTTALATSCAANQTLTYNSVGDNLTCSNISLPAGQVTGTLGIANGGTGQTTANAALNALLPSQTSQGTKFLQTDGTNTSWASVSFTETDPKVGANATNYLSKWDGSALVASGIVEVGGSIGIGTASPAAKLDVVGAAPSIRLQTTSNGDGSLSRVMAGLEMSARGMNTTSQYTPALKFMSTDTDFTTENPKFLAGIVGRAMQSYTDDTKGSMSIDFLTTPHDPGPSNIPQTRMTIGYDGNVGIGTTSPGQKLTVAGTIESTSGGFKFPDGSTQTTAATGGSTTGGAPHLLVREEYASGSGPTGSTASTWVKRNINTVSFNNLSGSSLASNRISLPAGDYYIEWSAPALYTATGGLASHTRIYNVTASAVIGYGAVCNTDNYAPTICVGSQFFTLTGTTNIEIQQWANKTRSEGFGSATTSGGTEVFTIVKIWKR